MTPTTTPTEPDTVTPIVLTVPQAAALLGWSRRSTYRAVEADAIEHIRVGRRIVIPTAKLLDQLGLPIDAIDWDLS